MKLGTKLLGAAAAAVLLTTVGGIVTVYLLSSRNRVVELRELMSSIVEQSESVAGSMDYMYKNDAFDQDGLMRKAKAAAGGRPLSEVYSSTALYSTIPIVAAWRSVEAAAKRNGFEFFTPTRPGVPARNPKNEYGEKFAEVFKAFERGEKEYFFHDKQRQHLVLARPVYLSASCLSCHGDPAKSRSGDGKDILGLPMENMKLGDIKGAFVLDAKISDDPVVKATVVSMVLAAGVTLFVVLIGFHFFSGRTIIRPLSGTIDEINQASAQTTSASNQIASASQQLAEGASDQAASLEETSASLEEMTSMVRRTAESVRTAKQLTSETRVAADHGNQSNQRLHGSLDLIRNTSNDMRAAVDGIKASSNNVAQIIQTIDEIAFQTNILALNAAVEAARAGEAGQGFAVVAEEVRNLAQRSATAARQTADLIDEAVKHSNQGVAMNEKVFESVATVASAADEVGQALKEIVTRVEQVDRQVGEIAGAASEQSSGIQQINIAISQLDKVTQSNAASAEESAGACEELNAQAATLRSSIHALQSLIAGQTTAESRSEPQSFDVAPRRSHPSTTGHSRPASPAIQARNNVHSAQAAGRNASHAPAPNDDRSLTF